jgi:hypothetical protein
MAGKVTVHFSPEMSDPLVVDLEDGQDSPSGTLTYKCLLQKLERALRLEPGHFEIEFIDRRTKESVEVSHQRVELAFQNWNVELFLRKARPSTTHRPNRECHIKSFIAKTMLGNKPGPAGTRTGYHFSKGERRPVEPGFAT